MMRPFQLNRSNTMVYGSVLEKIEILRSQLRWADQLDQSDISKLFRQCNELRGEVIGLSRMERLCEGSENVDAKPASHLSTSQRRQALVERDFVFEGIFGENPQLLEALEVVEKAAPTELPVLIQGESGTGKELMAKVLHGNSSRSDGPFISLNCGAIPENLLESELFGHKKGAFTGASTDRKGKFESANNGTIFLDEIGDLPLSGQVKLLRVLQSQEIQRVGSDEPIRVNARVIAATNQDLLAMVHAGTFREDLYYRLSIIEVMLPPLRERCDEIPLLIDFFCAEAAEQLQRMPLKLTPELHRFFLQYTFPGNVRELRNLIFRMSCLAADTADLSHLPIGITQGKTEAEKPISSTAPIDKQSFTEAKKAAIDTAERHFLDRGLKETGGRVVELAQRSGMNRSYLQTMMKKHGLSAADFRRMQ